MTTNNTYLKTIAEKVTETTISGTHPNNHYLRLICEKYGYTYTGTVCDGKLIKDFASYVTGKTYNRIHFDNKYYHDIAESLTGNTYDNKYDNFYLGIIAENITPPTPIKKLDHIGVELIAGNQILSYADEQQSPDSQYATVRFTAYDEEDTVIPNLALDFKVGSGAVTTVTTDSDGRYEYTYHSQGVGDVEISASKTVDGSLLIQTYSIEDCTYANMTEITGDLTFDLDLPNTFSIEYEDYIISNKPSFVYVGETNSKALLIGKIKSSENTYLLWARNGSDVQLNDGTCPTHTWTSEKITYDGTTVNFNNGAITTTNLNGVSLDKLISYSSWASAYIRNIKVKPL